MRGILISLRPGGVLPLMSQQILQRVGSVEMPNALHLRVRARGELAVSRQAGATA